MSKIKFLSYLTSWKLNSVEVSFLWLFQTRKTIVGVTFLLSVIVTEPIQNGFYYILNVTITPMERAVSQICGFMGIKEKNLREIYQQPIQITGDDRICGHQLTS